MDREETHYVILLRVQNEVAAGELTELEGSGALPECVALSKAVVPEGRQLLVQITHHDVSKIPGLLYPCRCTTFLCVRTVCWRRSIRQGGVSGAMGEHPVHAQEIVPAHRALLLQHL